MFSFVTRLHDNKESILRDQLAQRARTSDIWPSAPLSPLFYSSIFSYTVQLTWGCRKSIRNGWLKYSKIMAVGVTTDRRGSNRKWQGNTTSTEQRTTTGNNKTYMQVNKSRKEQKTRKVEIWSKRKCTAGRDVQLVVTETKVQCERADE